MLRTLRRAIARALDARRHPGEYPTQRQYRRYREGLDVRPPARFMARPGVAVVEVIDPNGQVVSRREIAWSGGVGAEVVADWPPIVENDRGIVVEPSRFVEVDQARREGRL